jgi:hypothetical protein
MQTSSHKYSMTGATLHFSTTRAVPWPMDWPWSSTDWATTTTGPRSTRFAHMGLHEERGI